MAQNLLIRNPSWTCKYLSVGVLGLTLWIGKPVAAMTTSELLKDLPEGKINFEVVLRYALGSQGFLAVAGSLAQSQALVLRAEAPLDFKVTAKIQSVRDLSKPQTILSPEEVAYRSTGLGLGKSFLTGTSLQFDWLSKRVDTRFANLATGNPAFDSVLKDRNEYMPEVSVTLKQDLLKNGFGKGIRANLEAGDLQKRIYETQVRESLKDWYLDLLKIFYGAWLAQEQVRQAEKDLQREQRLFRVSASRYRRGNTELADYLQIKVALNLAEQRTFSARQKLKSLWRDIVVQLELPTTWVEINAIEIPVVLDDPMVEAEASCRQGWKEDDHAPLKMARWEVENAKVQRVAVQSRALPDVSLFASVKRGARNASADEAWTEISQGDYPVTNLGLQAEWNLNSSLETAQVLEAKVNQLKSEALLSVRRGKFQSGWLAECEAFLRLKENEIQLQQALKDQTQRVDLEEKRFREGRSMLFQVVQAQGDLNSNQALENQNAVDLRLAAWEILKQSPKMESVLDQLVASFSEKRSSYE